MKSWRSDTGWCCLCRDYRPTTDMIVCLGQWVCFEHTTEEVQDYIRFKLGYAG